MARVQTKHDSLKLRGYLEFVLRDARTGEIVRKGRKKNTVTCWGRGWALAKLTPGSNASVLQTMAIGSISSTAPASVQSVMGGYMTIQTFNAGTTLATATNTTANFKAAVSFASNETWSGSSQIGEFALYDSTATGGSGVMFDRVVTSTYINFDSTNTLAVTITITN